MQGKTQTCLMQVSKICKKSIHITHLLLKGLGHQDHCVYRQYRAQVHLKDIFTMLSSMKHAKDFCFTAWLLSILNQMPDRPWRLKKVKSERFQSLSNEMCLLLHRWPLCFTNILWRNITWAINSALCWVGSDVLTESSHFSGWRGGKFAQAFRGRLSESRN